MATDLGKDECTTGHYIVRTSVSLLIEIVLKFMLAGTAHVIHCERVYTRLVLTITDLYHVCRFK